VVKDEGLLWPIPTTSPGYERVISWNAWRAEDSASVPDLIRGDLGVLDAGIGHEAVSSSNGSGSAQSVGIARACHDGI
jgi:hypothetical protein